MALSVDEIRGKARPVLESYGVKDAAVFGSYARGEGTEGSDVDILVRIEKDLSLLDFVGLKQDLEDALGVSVDVVEYGALKPGLRDRVMDERVALV